MYHENGTELLIQNVNTEANGNFSCMAISESGNGVSDPVNLKVLCKWPAFDGCVHCAHTQWTEKKLAKNLAKTRSLYRLANLLYGEDNLRRIHLGARGNQMQSGLRTASAHVLLVAELQRSPQTDAVARLS